MVNIETDAQLQNNEDLNPFVAHVHVTAEVICNEDFNPFFAHVHVSPAVNSLMHFINSEEHSELPST